MRKTNFHIERFQLLLQAKGLPKRVLVDRAGIDETTLNRILEGKQQPSSELVLKFARALGVNVIDLVTSPFGSMITELRNARGISLHNLATHVGVSAETLQAIEALQLNPDPDLLRRIEEALHGLWTSELREFDIHFSSHFSPSEVKGVLTALADYYRACGGVGFEVQLELEEAFVEEPEPSHA